MTEEKIRVEEYAVSGDELVHKVKQIVHEGNIRRISIKKIYYYLAGIVQDLLPGLFGNAKYFPSIPV